VIYLRLGIYGGTFNPPHIGHINASAAAARQLRLDVLIIIPTGIPPHKGLPTGSPTNENRMEMARCAFSGLAFAQVSDLELKKEGISYTSETLDELLKEYPGAEAFLIVGSDMYLSLETWKNAQHLLACATPCVLSRGEGADKELPAIKTYAEKIHRQFNAQTIVIDNVVTDISSTELRQALPQRRGSEYLNEMTYAYIIKNRLYGARADFSWLRERAFETMKPKRIQHTLGCEAEAARLAQRWGADADEAHEAAILHDITKHLELDEQLQLCRKYDIMTDTIELSEVKLLHAKTGAAVARDLYGASKSVHDAIFWHTTGKANMTLLEKIIYIADYIEPTREFDGLDALRSLAYRDLDQAIVKGLEMSIEDMKARGIVSHRRTDEALAWLLHTEPTAQRG
jgi:nicotinate-nucleotide adenylyltransferase